MPFLALSSFLVLMFRIQSKLMSAIEPEESEKHGNPFAVERAAMAYTKKRVDETKVDFSLLGKTRISKCSSLPRFLDRTCRER